MEPFTTHKGVAAPLLRDNIDTDQIIPSREMKSVGKTGLAEGLFAGWRYLSPNDRTPNPDFILNVPAFKRSSVLIAGANFGCGSSREHAVWALVEFGFRAIIAESFGSIFRANAVRNGLLPITLARDTIDQLAAQPCDDSLPRIVEIDLNHCTIKHFGEDGHGLIAFSLPEADREMLINGYDPIDLTLKRKSEIDAFLLEHRSKRPWIYRDAV